jgi:hypothetical protein
MKTINLIGKKKDYLTIIAIDGHKRDKVCWIALCDCGKKTRITGGDFSRKDGRNIKSCGCKNYLKGSESPHWRGRFGISSSYWTRTKFGAKKRGFDFKINERDAYLVLQKQKNLCALSGIPIILEKDASLDRIDSKKGYVKGNIQWLHKDINRIKSDLDQNYFISLCKQIANGK